MNDVTAFPPLGCRGKLVDIVFKSIRPDAVYYAFLGEPILFRPHWAGKCNLVAYKLHARPYDGLYVVSAIESWSSDEVDAAIYRKLRQPECYLALVDDTGDEPTWAVSKLWRVDFDTIPKHFLPPPKSKPLESS